MYVVALVALASSVEDAAPLVAADLGTSTYDAAMLLRGGFPAVVLRTPEKSAALGLLGKLRAHGHDAVACDTAAVIATEDMTLVRAPRFDDAALATGDAQLPYADVFALVRATHHTRTQTTDVSREKKFSLGRAALTGGVVLSKTVTNETRSASDEREPVLYVFRRSGTGAPWILRAAHARYDGLGAELRPSQLENFQVTVRLLRERAPRAFYDERLLAVRAVPEKLRSDVRGREQVATSAGGVDVLAHLVALSLARRVRSDPA